MIHRFCKGFPNFRMPLYSSFRVDRLQFIVYAGNMTEENASGVVAKFH